MGAKRSQTNGAPTLTFSVCLTKGKRSQYLRVVSTHGVYSKDLVGPHKSYEAEPSAISLSSSVFFHMFFLHVPLFRGVNALNIVSEKYESIYI